jgi:hypothetical protein
MADSDPRPVEVEVEVQVVGVPQSAGDDEDRSKHRGIED